VWKRWGTPTKCNNPLKNHYDLCMLHGYGRTLSIIKKQALKGLKRTFDDVWYLVVYAQMIKNESKEKWKHLYISITRGMKSLLGVAWCMVMSSLEQPSSLHVSSSSMLIAPYLCESCQLWQHPSSLKAISSDKDIHSLSNVAREKVENLIVNMCSTIRNNNYDNIPKCIGGYYMLILARALKQMGT